MSAALPAFSDHPPHSKSWHAAIALVLRAGPVRTDLVRCDHQGPLRVQRPFYPEGECCHIYLLHPPGGMVPGDVLQIDLDLQACAQALLTTPAAGKLYRSDLAQTPQLQGIQASVAEGACLEWLPQETIVFEAAEGELHNRFELKGDAKLFAWDIVVLGRRASGEGFARGRCLQRVDILRDGRPLLAERTLWQGGSAMLDAPWGMAGRSVSGTLFATLSADGATLDSLRERLAAQPWFDLAGGEWGLSQRRDLFMARYLGDSPEHCRKGFEFLWQALRPLFKGQTASRPRIWNT